jgi:hypothetical protein
MDTISLRRSVAQELENCVNTEYGGTKFHNIPDKMRGIGVPVKAKNCNPLPEDFNASRFAYLSVLDQVNE